MSATEPRGIRLCNPGNIRRCQTQWQGEAREQDDSAFLRFSAPEWGIRAMAKVLLTYQAHGLFSVRKMISRWAPANENDTEAYIAHVADVMGVLPDDPVNLRADPQRFIAMLEAIIRHENGQQPYPGDLIRHAIALAGVVYA